MKKVFIITGEHSGDMHAGKVIEILKSENPDLEICGIGGENLKNAGAKIFCDHSKMSGFGINIKMTHLHTAVGAGGDCRKLFNRDFATGDGDKFIVI